MVWDLSSWVRARVMQDVQWPGVGRCEVLVPNSIQVSQASSCRHRDWHASLSAASAIGQPEVGEVEHLMGAVGSGIGLRIRRAAQRLPKCSGSP
jgi:hypothetical protein